MNPRIEKKLSKRLVSLMPKMYRSAFRDDEPYEHGSGIKHCLSVGGGCDYFGEPNDVYTVWADWRMNWPWHGQFEEYPPDHKFAFMPNTKGFRPTTKNLLGLAADCGRRDK